MKLGENVRSEMGILGALVMAIGGAILFYFLYESTTAYFQNIFPNADALVAFLGFMSFLFLGLGLLLIIQSGKKD